jgi:hypothetical protein
MVVCPVDNIQFCTLSGDNFRTGRVAAGEEIKHQVSDEPLQLFTHWLQWHSKGPAVRHHAGMLFQAMEIGVKLLEIKALS